jgi:hypothetical protein
LDAPRPFRVGDFARRRDQERWGLITNIQIIYGQEEALLQLTPDRSWRNCINPWLGDLVHYDPTEEERAPWDPLRTEILAKLMLRDLSR